MIPEYFPIITKDDILISHSDYELGDKKTTTGWLKYLFLWRTNGEYLTIEKQDRKDHAEIVKLFKQVNDLPKSTNLHDWEETVSEAKQASALEKLRKKLGYTVVEYLTEPMI
jgi:hypothetical protein